MYVGKAGGAWLTLAGVCEIDVDFYSWAVSQRVISNKRHGEFSIMTMSHLSFLESEAIEIMREVVAESKIQSCYIRLVKTVQ